MSQGQFYCEQCGGEMKLLPNGLLQCIYNPAHIQRCPSDYEGMYLRAQTLRRSMKFDEAIKIYEKILMENPKESQAYWEMLLAVYGIEYVRDYNGDYLPTCHRIVEKSILKTEEYRKALECALTNEEIEKYREQGRLIEKYQGQIKRIAENEEPYEVFISFKAQDEWGNPTEERREADRIYNFLTKEFKRKVFYAPVSLAGKTGEYEPYIYAALKSAAAMVIVGGSRKNLESPWVQNEWSRYLRFLREEERIGGKKNIAIALTNNMRPEELPVELAGYQANDITLPNAVETLCRNINNILPAVISPIPPVSPIPSQDIRQQEIANLVMLGDTYREMKEYAQACLHYDNALKRDHGCAKAYWGRLLARHHIYNSSVRLEKSMKMVENDPDYIVAVKFSTDTVKTYYQNLLKICCSEFEERKSLEEEQERYDKAYKSLNESYQKRTPMGEGILDQTKEVITEWSKKCQIWEEAKQAKTAAEFKVDIYGWLYILMLCPMVLASPYTARVAWGHTVYMCYLYGFIILFVFFGFGLGGGTGVFIGLIVGYIPTKTITKLMTISSVSGVVWKVTLVVAIICGIMLSRCYKKIKETKDRQKMCEAVWMESDDKVRKALKEELKRLNEETVKRPYGNKVQLKNELRLD